MQTKHLVYLAVVSFVILGLTACPKKAKKPVEVTPPSDEVVETPETPVEPASPEELSIHDKEFHSVPELKTVNFAYDKYNIVSQAAADLQENAKYLGSNKYLEILVEGNCCECGTNEYNMSLGQKRAQVVRDYYIKLGIAASRVGTISYGEEKPINVHAGPPDSDECNANRRAETKVRKTAK